MKLQGGGWKVMWEVGVRRIKARVGGKEGMGVGKPVAEIERGAVVVVVQWLGWQAFTAVGTGGTPGQESRIPRAKAKINK